IGRAGSRLWRARSSVAGRSDRRARRTAGGQLDAGDPELGAVDPPVAAAVREASAELGSVARPGRGRRHGRRAAEPTTGHADSPGTFLATGLRPEPGAVDDEGTAGGAANESCAVAA